MKECLEEVVTKWKLIMKHLITDRHPQIRAFMRDFHGPLRKKAAKSNPLIIHYFYLWHVAKGD